MHFIQPTKAKTLINFGILELGIILNKKKLIIYCIGAGGLKADQLEASQIFQELSKEGHPQAQVSNNFGFLILIKINHKDYL